MRLFPDHKQPQQRMPRARSSILSGNGSTMVCGPSLVRATKRGVTSCPCPMICVENSISCRTRVRKSSRDGRLAMVHLACWRSLSENSAQSGYIAYGAGRTSCGLCANPPICRASARLMNLTKGACVCFHVFQIAQRSSSHVRYRRLTANEDEAQHQGGIGNISSTL